MLKFVICQSVLGLAIVSAILLMYRFKKSVNDLPQGWNKASSTRNFKLSVLFLILYLTINFIGEQIATSMAYRGIYNCYVIISNYALYIPLLFGFLFINTSKIWKKYSYVLLYLILFTHFLWMDYFDPNSVLSINTSRMIDIIIFIATLLHLTDILINPKSDNIRFQLKIDLNILAYFLLSNITSAFNIHGADPNELIYLMHYMITILYYSSFCLIFTSEIIKLKHRDNSY